MNTTNSIIKKYDNITVTVETQESIDHEMMNLMKQYHDSAAYFENTKTVYQPKIDGIALTKAEAIQKQIDSLGDLAIEVGYSGPIIANYLSNKNGQQMSFRVKVHNEKYFPNYQIIIDEYSSQLTYSSMMKYVATNRYSKENDSVLVNWEEYAIYDKLRLYLMNRIKEKINRNYDAGNHIIDQYNDIAGN